MIATQHHFWYIRIVKILEVYQQPSDQRHKLQALLFGKIQNPDQITSLETRERKLSITNMK